MHRGYQVKVTQVAQEFGKAMVAGAAEAEAALAEAAQDPMETLVVAVVLNLMIMVFPTPVVLVSVLVRIVMLVVGVELVGCPENDVRRVGGH